MRGDNRDHLDKLAKTIQPTVEVIFNALGKDKS